MARTTSRCSTCAAKYQASRPVKRRMYPTKQIAVAQMRIQLESMRSLFTRAVLEAKPNPTKDEKLRLYAAHYSVMEGANDIARLAIRTCGGTEHDEAPAAGAHVPRQPLRLAHAALDSRAGA
jgi:alkylation response protein AidB-like acyl-CoA dehydrogenase